MSKIVFRFNIISIPKNRTRHTCVHWHEYIQTEGIMKWSHISRLRDWISIWTHFHMPWINISSEVSNRFSVTMTSYVLHNTVSTSIKYDHNPKFQSVLSHVVPLKNLMNFTKRFKTNCYIYIYIYNDVWRLC